MKFDFKGPIYDIGVFIYDINWKKWGMEMEKKRDSGIEMLRILAMLMVIGVHIFAYGKYLTEPVNIRELLPIAHIF